MHSCPGQEALITAPKFLSSRMLIARNYNTMEEQFLHKRSPNSVYGLYDSYSGWQSKSLGGTHGENPLSGVPRFVPRGRRRDPRSRVWFSPVGALRGVRSMRDTFPSSDAWGLRTCGILSVRLPQYDAHGISEQGPK